MPNKRRIADYAVQFIGYSARIIAREGNTDYASLDFVSGTAALFAHDGHLIVPSRTALSSAVGDLPNCIDELKSLVESDTPDSDGHRVELRSGQLSIRINRGADIERFVSQIAQRYRAIKAILEPAEKLGSEIERPPYADYLDEIEKTGISRIVSYGVAYFVDGKLAYYPERETALIKPMADGRTFQVLEHWKGQLRTR
jgi:hypothetical protein